MERLCECVSISTNKNTLPHDKSALNPTGIRLGAHAMTSRGFLEDDFRRVGVFISEAANVTQQVQLSCGGNKLKKFTEYIKNNNIPEVTALKKEVESFAESFPTVGQ
eukprot:GHVR01144096.1.p1 GENE.GHVR01144096.1~~GHVR01144096.1.p1  ORF type:complete len:107 (-),score=26.81 GHVR01144096.1:99-419(-)